MAIYRGVDNVARKVTKQYRGIDNVARKISKEYRGVDNVARLVFGDNYYIDTAVNNADLLADYSFDIDGDTIGISLTTTGNRGNEGDIILYVKHTGEFGEFAGKTISFDYDAVGYNVRHSTIYYLESHKSGALEETKKYFDGTGSYSTITDDECIWISFRIWLSGAGGAGTKSITISNLKIDGEPIIF